MKKALMIELKREALIGEHELTDDQLETLIEEKFLRARQYYEALQNREEKVHNEFE